MHARILNLMHADVHPVNTHTHTHNEWVGGVDSDKRRVKASETALVNDEMMEHRGDETRRKSEHLARISTPRGAQHHPMFGSCPPRDHRCSLQQQLTLPLQQRGSQVIGSSLHMIRFRIKYARIRLGFILLSFLTGRICRSF